MAKIAWSTFETIVILGAAWGEGVALHRIFGWDVATVQISVLTLVVFAGFYLNKLGARSIHGDAETERR